MSSRGEEFLKDWIERNITESDHPGSRVLATILGARCRRGQLPKVLAS